MNLLAMGIGPRLALAALPALSVHVAEDWLPNCWGTDSPLCVWVWHPPFIDVLFGVLVLAPFMATGKLWPLRMLGLVAGSVMVHVLAIGLVVNTSLDWLLPQVPIPFLNVIPIAVGASLVLAALTALVAGLAIRPRYWACAAAAGLTAAGVFLAPDLNSAWGDAFRPEVWVWPAWHLALCAAIYYGRAPAGAVPEHWPQPPPRS